MTFADLVRLARAHRWALIGCTVLGILVSVGLTTREPVLYEATSTGYIQVGSAQSAPEEAGNLALAKEKAALYVALVSTTPVAERVVDDLNLGLPPSSVASRFSAYADAAGLLRIRAVGTTPREAQELATAVVEAVADEAEDLQNPAGKGRTSLVTIVPYDEAELPSDPFTPDYRKAALKGAGAGFALAAGVILLRRTLDRRIRSVSDVEEATGGSVVGVIPKVNELAHHARGVEGDLGRAAEAFRQLRTNLRFVDVDKPPRRIVITSALPGEGKSTVSANLARLVAQTGEKVVLIDADLRRPTMAGTFGIDGHVGLTQVVAGDVAVSQALVESDIPNLVLLPSGRIPPNPSELLGSDRMRRLIDTLALDHLVLLDAPPLLPVTDAGLLAAACDGVLLVQAAGKTQIEHSQHCRRILDQVGGRLLGVVLNKAPQKGPMATAYGGYGYAATEYTSLEPGSVRAEAKEPRGRRRSAKTT
ncbi:polysaccharide biosynthesis tyrosine autokinase [Nocardioides sp.]|uniref:polysaccharide biosynthesis tyrosine autokinase n=1 Tax=Nocardioides sp. TaxID=35761 RepID=UPI002CE168DE|nr:polysaccharide biosynthesis tyrosine autokinase [Nocardioides sp.]HXH77222.1 polysaccharide biosynthesis tyrosine autokinase [Nocardioides sp.]